MIPTEPKQPDELTVRHDPAGTQPAGPPHPPKGTRMNLTDQRAQEAADTYMLGRGADMPMNTYWQRRRAFLAGWDAAKRDSHQARQAKRDDIAHELLADDRDTPEGDNRE